MDAHSDSAGRKRKLTEESDSLLQKLSQHIDSTSFKAVSKFLRSVFLEIVPTDRHRDENAVIVRDDSNQRSRTLKNQKTELMPLDNCEMLPLDNSQIYDVFLYLLSEYIDTPDLAPVYWTSRQHQKLTHKLLVRRSAQAKWTFPVTGLTYYRYVYDCTECQCKIEDYVHGATVPSLPLTLMQWWTREIRKPRREDLLSAIQLGNQKVIDVILHQLNYASFIPWKIYAMKKAAKYGQAGVILSIGVTPHELLSAAYAAIDAGQLGVLKAIYHLDRDVPEELEEISDAAAENGNLEMIEWLVQESFVILDASFVQTMALYGHTHVLDWMEKYHPEQLNVVEAQKCASFVDTMKWCLERGAPLTMSNLEMTALKGREEGWKWAVEHSRINYDPSELLPQAIAGGSLYIVRNLVEKGCPPKLLEELDFYNLLGEDPFKVIRKKPEEYYSIFSYLISLGFSFPPSVVYQVDRYGPYKIYELALTTGAFGNEDYEKKTKDIDLPSKRHCSMETIEMYVWKIARKWGVSMEEAEKWCEEEDGNFLAVFERGRKEDLLSAYPELDCI